MAYQLMGAAQPVPQPSEAYKSASQPVPSNMASRTYDYMLMNGGEMPKAGAVEMDPITGEPRVTPQSTGGTMAPGGRPPSGAVEMDPITGAPRGAAPGGAGTGYQGQGGGMFENIENPWTAQDRGASFDPHGTRMFDWFVQRAGISPIALAEAYGQFSSSGKFRGSFEDYLYAVGKHAERYGAGATYQPSGDWSGAAAQQEFGGARAGGARRELTMGVASGNAPPQSNAPQSVSDAGAPETQQSTGGTLAPGARPPPGAVEMDPITGEPRGPRPGDPNRPPPPGTYTPPPPPSTTSPPPPTSGRPPGTLAPGERPPPGAVEIDPITGEPRTGRRPPGRVDIMDPSSVDVSQIPGMGSSPGDPDGYGNLNANMLNLYVDRDITEFGGVGGVGGNSVNQDGTWNMPDWLRNSASRYGEANTDALNRDVSDQELVERRLAGLMREDNELNQMAKEDALAQAAKSGMLGSGVAAGAALRASRGAMMPIAQQDAATYNQVLSANMDASNRDLLADQQNRTGLLSQEIGTAANLLDSATDRRWRSRESNTDRTHELVRDDLGFRRGSIDREDQQDFNWRSRQDDQGFNWRSRQDQNQFDWRSRVDQNQFDWSSRSDQNQFNWATQEDAQEFNSWQSGLDRDLQERMLRMDHDNTLTQQDRAHRQQRIMGFYETTFGREGMLGNIINSIMNNPNLTPEQQRAAITNARTTLEGMWDSFNTTLEGGVPNIYYDPYPEGDPPPGGETGPGDDDDDGTPPDDATPPGGDTGPDNPPPGDDSVEGGA